MIQTCRYLGLTRLLSSGAISFMGKIVSMSTIGQQVKPWTASVIPGSFDLFHVGHLRAIKRSSEATRPMVVVVASDNRVKKRKGMVRPCVNETYRMELIAALSFVDYVVPWNEDSHDAYLRAIRPRRITFEKHEERRGEEYYKRIDHISTEYKPTEVLLLPRTEGISTTITVQNIVACLDKERRSEFGSVERPGCFVAKPGQIDYTKARWAPIINCVLKCENKILLVRRSSLMKMNPGLWNGIAGYLDDQLSLEQKVVEELYEELALDSKHIKQILRGEVLVQDDPVNNKTWVVNPVLVEVDTFDVRLNWEAEEYRWVHPSELDLFSLLPGFLEVVKKLLIQQY